MFDFESVKDANILRLLSVKLAGYLSKSEITLLTVKLNIENVHRVEDLTDVMLHLGSQCLILDDELRFVGCSASGDQNVFHMPSSFLEGRLANDLLIDTELKATVLALLVEALTSKGVHMLKPSTGETKALAYSPENSKRVYLVSFENNENAELIKWFSNHSNFVACLSRSGDITFHNETFFPSFDKISNLLDVVFEGDKPIVESTLKRVIKDNKAMKCQALLNGLGQHNWVEISLVPMNTHGKKCWVEIKNISELKDAEYANSSQIKILNEVIEGLDKAIIVSNREGSVVYQNSQSTQMFGSQFSHLIDLAHQTSGKWFKMDGNTPINAFELPFGGFMADVDESLEYEYLFQLDEDQNIPLQIKVHKSDALELKDELYVWNFSDVSDSHYASMKLEETNKHLDNFVRATAHDLKSPVTNIMNLFSLMDKFEDQSKKDMVLAKIKASAEKLDDLLGGLMEMVDAQGNQQINIEELDFDEVTNFVLSECNMDELAGKVKITSNFEVEQIIYNKAYLRSILLNLINNAIKYRDESRLCEIKLSTQMHGEEVVLKITDNGSGIDLDKHGNNLFKPFKRLTAKGSGKGIGLSLIKNFVEKNGGQVFVESKVGEGTTFACVLVPYPNNDFQTSMF